MIENNFTDCLIGNIMTELLQYNDIHLDEKNRDLYEKYGEKIEKYRLYQLLQREVSFFDLYTECILFMHEKSLTPEETYDLKLQNKNSRITYPHWMNFSRSWSLEWAEWYRSLTHRQKTGYIWGSGIMNNIKYFYLRDRLLKLAGQNNLPLDDIMAAQLKRAAPHVPNEWESCLRSAEQIITKRLNTPPNDLELPGIREFETFMGETAKDLK